VRAYLAVKQFRDHSSRNAIVNAKEVHAQLLDKQAARGSDEILDVPIDYDEFVQRVGDVCRDNNAYPNPLTGFAQNRARRRG
jgi:hypothetical protein